MIDWLVSLNWGDVPSWIAIVVTIAIPAIAYAERNRIAGFFKRKAAEPLPALPPARWLLRPTNIEARWGLFNNSDAEVHNVAISPTMVGSEVMDAGFWALFLPRSVGTVFLRRNAEAVSHGFTTDFELTWQDANGVERAQLLAVPAHVDFSKGSALPVIDEGKVVLLTIDADTSNRPEA